MPASHAAGLIRHGIALGMLCGLAASAWAVDETATESSGSSGSVQSADAPIIPMPQFNFDIPMQPLAAALERYAGIAHLSIMVPSDMVRDLKSSPLQGRYSSEAALRQLLDGTGLVAEAHDSGAAGKTYLLKEAAKPAAAPAGLAALYSQGSYPGLVQLRIWQALCAHARTAPGRYRLLFQFQMDAAGHLADTRLLVSTGDRHRDAEVLDALQQVQVEAPPPPALMHQSVLMSLLPDSPGADHRCDQGKP
jgi:TonB family protein